MRQESAAAPFAAVHLTFSEDGARLDGTVLTLRQAERLALAARGSGTAMAVAALADPGARLEQGWLEFPGDVLEVWRDPASIGDDAARQTEYVRDDGPLRHLGDAPGALLVQGADLSLGWVDAGLVRQCDAEAGREAWAAVTRARPGEAIAALDDADAEGLVAAARDWLGVPYRWGGTTRRGADCSGFVQRVFARHTGVLLPKHTGDQRAIGVRVRAAEARAGDLLFATLIGQRVGHVLVVSHDASVIHACRSEKRVIEEPLASNRERYQHQGFRRVVDLAS